MRYPRPLLVVAALVVSVGLARGLRKQQPPIRSPTSTARPAQGSSGQAVTGTTITIKNFAFSPSTLTVGAGANITVHNIDSATHTVPSSTASRAAFTTGDVGPGGTVTFTAPTKAGTYPYVCMIHQFMHGTLVVR